MLVQWWIKSRNQWARPELRKYLFRETTISGKCYHGRR